MQETELLPAPDVAGTSLDGTKIFTITAEENAALCRSTGVEPADDGSAHPIYYYIATQVAMGKTVAGVCETCEFDVEEGPMMGSSGVRFQAPLMVGESYRVTGEILSLVRKLSRKLGVMDVLTYRLRLHRQADGTCVVETDNVWVLPRKELAA
ncbi:hypothetical protein [Blastomonas fulva]|uniref:hypothetical protein n=1 Tax=Blastomonas fulva TaxID=1550728 RepID=UPI003D2B7906